jgi:hypothetical protein
MSHRSRRAYDHRIKEEIIRAGDPELYPELEIPRSTAVSWIRRGPGEIVLLVKADGGEPALRDRIARREGRVAMLTAVLGLVLALLRVSGFSLERSRVPDGAGKRRLVGAVERARRAMPLSAALRVLRPSSARYHVWVRAENVCTAVHQDILEFLSSLRFDNLGAFGRTRSPLQSTDFPRRRPGSWRRIWRRAGPGSALGPALTNRARSSWRTRSAGISRATKGARTIGSTRPRIGLGSRRA